MKSRKEREGNEQEIVSFSENDQLSDNVRRRRGSLIAMERKKEILSILSQKRKTTYAEIAREFGVSTKTIQMDIEELILVHPIETSRGRNGGVWLPDGYYPHSMKMTVEQTSLCRKLAAQLSGLDSEVMKSILAQFGRKNF